MVALTELHAGGVPPTPGFGTLAPALHLLVPPWLAPVSSRCPDEVAADGQPGQVTYRANPAGRRGDKKGPPLLAGNCWNRHFHTHSLATGRSAKGLSIAVTRHRFR